MDFQQYHIADKNRVSADLYVDAQVISSELNSTYQYGDPQDPMHVVALDLDHAAWLIPSSTNDHSHLYIDLPIPWSKYSKLLDVLAECGIIEKGYRDASVKRKATFLRLPWVKKGAETLQSLPMIERFLADVDPEPPAETAEGCPSGQTNHSAQPAAAQAATTRPDLPF